MKITSTEFNNCEYIPPEFSCEGENITPPLEFEDVPKEAKSLALIMDDPDAPTGTFTHWIVWNLPPGTRELDGSNDLPLNAISGMNSAKKPGYVGPCPPSGEHRYFFKLYALDTMPDLFMNATKKDLEKAIKGHVIDKAELVGLYKKC